MSEPRGTVDLDRSGIFALQANVQAKSPARAIAARYSMEYLPYSRSFPRAREAKIPSKHKKEETAKATLTLARNWG